MIDIFIAMLLYGNILNANLSFPAAIKIKSLKNIEEVQLN